VKHAEKNYGENKHAVLKLSALEICPVLGLYAVYIGSC